MDKLVPLRLQTSDGTTLEAVFSPFFGMNLMSLKKNNIEIIDQSTVNLFIERRAGLGALIGPHFHHREPSSIPAISLSQEDFAHLSYVHRNKIIEPFSHGVGRYAPWEYEATTTGIKANLSGKMSWNGHLLKTLEGFDFAMTYEAELTATGIQIELTVSGERPCLIGLHTYYCLGNQSRLSAKVQPNYNVKGFFHPIPSQWQKKDPSALFLDLNQELDFGFLPLDKTQGTILYQSNEYSLRFHLRAPQEISFQVYRPKESSYICIEPLSTKNPRDLNSKSSSISISIDIL